jgi:O-antigen ligase
LLKVILYVSLALFGVVAALFSPLAGAIACIESYLINPSVFELHDGGFRYQLIVTVAFLFSCVIYRPRGAARVGREGWVLWALWVFAAIALLSATWAVVSPTVAFDSAYEIFKTVLFTALLVLTIRTERNLSLLMTATLVGILHASVLSVLGGRLGYVPDLPGRVAAVLPDPQQPVMVIFTPLLLLMAMTRSGAQRWLAWCSIPFVLDSIVGTYERTGFMCLLIQSVLLLFFLPRRITLRLLPALAVAGGLFVFVFTPPDYWTRMKTIENPDEEASAHSRFVINEASWRMLADYPWGVGYRNYPYVSPRYLPANMLSDGMRAAHNSYFTVVCETGVIGFAVWASAFIGAAWLLRRIRKRADSQAPTAVEIYAMGTELGLYGWMIGGCFQAHHEVDPAYWFVGIAVILTRLHGQKTETEDNEDRVEVDESQPVAVAPVSQ